MVKIAKILKDVAVEDIRPVTDALEAWRDGRTPGMEDVLRLLQNVNPHGTIITIDEAQELTHSLGTIERAKESIRQATCYAC